MCLDMLRSRKSQREESLDSQLTEPAAESSQARNPKQEAVLADSVGVALLVVLDTLTPAERLAFVMHDMFDVSFDEIASIIGRSPAAARQLASRALRATHGVPIHYSFQVKGEPALVFIHCWACYRQLWDKQVPGSQKIIES